MKKVILYKLIFTLALFSPFGFLLAQDADGDGIPDAQEYNFNTTKFGLDFSSLTRNNISTNLNSGIVTSISNKTITTTSNYSYANFSTSYSNAFNYSDGSFAPSPTGTVNGDLSLGIYPKTGINVVDIVNDYE